MSRSKRRQYIKKSLFFLLPLFLFFFAACSDQDHNIATITLNADPANLPADGYSQSLIEATVTRADGEEVRDRTEVKFRIVSGEGNIKKSSDTVDGTAHAILESSSNPGTATIRAEAMGSVAEITVNYESGEPAAMEGEPDPTSVNIAGAGGEATSQIVLDVMNVYGEAVGDGYRVDFEILEGPGGGEVLSPVSATTRDGQVATVLRSGTKSGPVTIRASYHDDPGVNITLKQIAINAGPPVGEEFGIFSDVYNIEGLLEANLEAQITVDVADVYGNAVPDGTAISFKTYNTGGRISPNMFNTLSGEATTTLYSSGTEPVDGFVSVTAEVDGGRTTHVRTIAVDPDDPRIMFVGTSGGGVYKSTNAGSDWENVSRSSDHDKLGQNFIAPYVNDISINPDNPETIYVATGYEGRGNIYRSTNGGLTWNSDNNPAEWGGLLQIGSAVLTILCDDGSNYVWAGTRDEGVIFSRDGEFSWNSNTLERVLLGSERIVRDIDKASGTGPSAVLYAATPSGVYKSVTGGRTWTEKTDFKGDNITTVTVHPEDPNTIYAGTQEYGVWFSTNGGDDWDQFIDGLGKGLKATTPAPDDGNAGTGLMGEVAISDTTDTETWTVVYNEAAEYWVVTGTNSGEQSARGKTGETYTSDNDEIEFVIMQGSKPFEDGDAFRFETVRDAGMNIKSLQVYHSPGDNAYYLYAITYSYGFRDHHAAGNVYVTALNPGLDYKPRGSWQEANRNLPENDPPDDTSLFAQHAIAVDNPFVSSRLFIGGQGINFYKAVSGLGDGDPLWEESKEGLSNRLMARIPILFSGQGRIHVNLVDEKRIEEDNGNDDVSWQVTFEVYVGDTNGNPPVEGSVFRAFIVEGKSLMEVTYPDSLRHTGSWNDPTDPNPYIIEEIVEEDTLFRFLLESGGPASSDWEEDFFYEIPEE